MIETAEAAPAPARPPAIAPGTPPAATAPMNHPAALLFHQI